MPRIWAARVRSPLDFISNANWPLDGAWASIVTNSPSLTSNSNSTSVEPGIAGVPRLAAVLNWRIGAGMLHQGCSYTGEGGVDRVAQHMLALAGAGEVAPLLFAAGILGAEFDVGVATDPVDFAPP